MGARWQRPRTKLCLAQAALVNTCECAHYLIKQNNNHGSIGSSPGLFVTEMLPGAIMTSVLLCLKHAKYDWIPRFRQAHEYRFQAVFKLFLFFYPAGVQCLHRCFQDSGTHQLLSMGFSLELLSWIIHIHISSVYQELLNITRDWFEFHSKLTNGCN